MVLTDRDEIRRWLADRGQSNDQIEAILQRLDQFDEQISRQSLFDALEAGEFDIDAIVREALNETRRRPK
jgi:hypothetical protein